MKVAACFNGHTNESFESLPPHIKLSMLDMWRIGAIGWKLPIGIGYQQFTMFEAFVRSQGKTASNNLLSLNEYDWIDRSLSQSKKETLTPGQKLYQQWKGVRRNLRIKGQYKE